MKHRPIALGAAPGDKTGMPLRVGGDLINDTFAEVERLLGRLYSPRDYGAFGDGASHTVGSVLGVSTLSGLAAYVHPELGGTPYSWITSGLWVKACVTLAASGAVANNSPTLPFASTTGVTVGMQVRGAGIQAGTTVTAVSGTSVTLSLNTNAAKAAGMTFSFVAPLTDADVAGLEMDSLAIQSAIQAAKDAGGGTVVAGLGTFLCDNTLVLPESGEFGGQQVNLTGAGHFLTLLRAKTDFGAGRYLLCCGDPVAHKNLLVGRYAFAYYEGFCRDFRVEGPVAKTPAATTTTNTMAYGTAPCQMSGIAHGSRREWKNVWAWYLRNGWDITGDHSLFTGCLGQYCYYGAYFNDSSPVLYGDMRMEYCFFMGNSFAGFGVSKNAYLNGLFIKPYLGGQPYSIVGEAGQADQYDQPFAGSAETPIIQGSTFVNGQYEWEGNGCIVDLGGGADGSGARARPLANSLFIGGFWSWNTDKQIAGRGQRYYFDVGQIEGMRFEDIGNGCFDLTGGQLACFRADAVGWYGGGCEISGAMDIVLDKYNGTLPFFAPMERYSDGQWRGVSIRCKTWRGTLGLVNDTAAVLKGTVMEASTDWNGIRPATATARPLVGIVVAGVPADAGGADRMVVVATGDNLKARYGSGSIAGGSWVKAAAGGALQPAAGPTETQVVGWAWTDGGGGATGSNDRLVKTTFAA